MSTDNWKGKRHSFDTEKEGILSKLWFSLSELGFPMITDEYGRPIHPEVEVHMRRYFTDEQDWEQVDNEDCWGMNYTGPTTEIKDKIESILHSWGGEQPEEQQVERKQQKLERERFSVPHASRDPETLIDSNLENKNNFEIIRNPQEVGAVRIFEKPEFRDTTTGLIKAVITQGIATIQLPSGPFHLDGAQWHLLKHTLDDSGSNTLEANIQYELKRQLSLDKDTKHRSYAWKILRAVKEFFQATKYQGDSSPHHPPFFKNAGRGNIRIWGEKNPTPQQMVINRSGQDDKKKLDLIPTLFTTDNWILLTQPLHSMTTEVRISIRGKMLVLTRTTI